MAEVTTLARPYAEALFRLADPGGRLEAWSRMLERMAGVAALAQMRECIADPALSADQLAELFVSMCEDLDEEARNLVRILVENRRLALLPQIRDSFEKLKDEREGVLKAQVFSAFPIDEARKAALVAGLERRFGRRVATTVELDRSLIGGVKVVVGDQVIDASVRAKLAAMAAALKS
ncbi:MAG: F0F1 ATP synthase subunit delta [Rhodocyclaceae bacterium]